MDNNDINQHLIGNGPIPEGVLPHLDALKKARFVFEVDFGLPVLPEEPGILLIRGPRQYGKSTWLEQQIAKTVHQFGPGSALYLNGDEIADYKTLVHSIRLLCGLFSTQSLVKRLFIDEITAVKDWQKAIKRLADAGELADILLITTGSKASDLRRGTERLPGRKGKLARTQYIFTPLSYRAFYQQCHDFFKSDTLMAYLLSGGSPIGANALADTGRLPEYLIETVNDWIIGEISASGRSRASLMAVVQNLYKMACTPIGQAKLARESGLANNTVAQGYIDLLADLMVIEPAFPYDPERHLTIFRKPCKYHFVNLLVALCWHPEKPRTIAELQALGPSLGVIFEWAVAQEIWRRTCISQSESMPEHLHFWQSKSHEIDFVLPDLKAYIEVKSGSENPVYFSWFIKNFPQGTLTVINQNTFTTNRLQGMTLEAFLSQSH